VQMQGAPKIVGPLPLRARAGGMYIACECTGRASMAIVACECTGRASMAPTIYKGRCMHAEVDYYSKGGVLVQGHSYHPAAIMNSTPL
jgi:hypothetical protein